MNVKTKKDKKWAISELTKSMNFFKAASRNGFSIEYFYGKELGTREAIQILEKLDEPEVLSHKSIDKKRLIERMENYIPLHDKTVGDVMNGILEIIKQLPELEVLSPEWIDENQHPYGGDYQVSSEKLEDLLVPKRELPVIPQFVADKLEQSKADGIHSVGVIFHGALNREYDAFLNNWILNNEKLFVEAFFAYPNIEVGEEQKYYVIFPSVDEDSKGFNYLAKDCYHKELWVEDTRTDGLVWEERSSFTEDEIRDLDKGDILFEHFSVNVKELEE